MWVHRRGRLNSAFGIESAWKRNDRMLAFSTLSEILTSPRGCVWQTHFTVHWLQEARHPCSKTFLPRNILFPFPAGTAWPGLKFFVSGARQLLIFISSCFPQHKGRPWLPSKQLTHYMSTSKGMVLHLHLPDAWVPLCSDMSSFGGARRLLLTPARSTVTIMWRHVVLENIITQGRDRSSVWGQKCERGAFQRTKRVASWPSLPSRVACGLNVIWVGRLSSVLPCWVRTLKCHFP